MRIKATILFAVVSVFAATATPITYTIAGIGSGTFYLPNHEDANAKATPFTNQPFSFSIKSDTSQVRGIAPGVNLAGTTDPTSVLIAVGSESGFLAEPNSSPYGLMGLLIGGNGDNLLLYLSAPLDAVLSIQNPAFYSYDLTTSIGPLTGPTQLNPEQREMALFIPVTFSTINFQSIEDVTFQASLATPEPGTLALIGLNLAAFGVWRGVRVKT
jgi:PEP-CTERM motif